jgi:dolichyl-phosphate-mannose--protein O-mannosyl transferase
MLIGLVCAVKLMSFWGTQFSRASPDDWYHPDLWKGLDTKDWIVGFVVFPLAAYFVTFVPFLLIDGKDYGFLQIFTTMQWNIWDGNLRVVSPHPYMSSWTDWPLTKRPIWYAFDHEGTHNELVRGVLFLGNPWIMWNGLIALVACLIGWLRERRRDAFLIVICYIAFYFSWAVIPRKIAFYYYYYPAGMVLSLALAYVFFHGEKKHKFKILWPRWTFLAVAVALFLYFFPISAALQIPLESFRRWMWRAAWI